MAEVKVVLNGKEVVVEEGTKIIDVCRKNGIPVPALCSASDLTHINSCFICVVELNKLRLVPSCGTVVADGMVIDTDTERVRDTRKACLELLLSNHYADCYAPCNRACPAGINVQGYVNFISSGKYSEAYELIREAMPLPGSVGRVCPAPCESECRRNAVEGAVDIRLLKRFVYDNVAAENKKRLDAREKSGRVKYNGKKVAVIGAGPAGLATAYYLGKKGYRVDIYEAMPAPGGMLKYGIPEYRLPKKVLGAEVDTILSETGARIFYNKKVGMPLTIDNIKSKGYHAVCIATGAWVDTKLGVPGDNVSGVFSGIEFLRMVAQGKKVKLGTEVIVVGGGNTAVDSARTALRLPGVKKVRIFYRRTKAEMPANSVEIEDAEHEGVKFEYLVAPVKVTEKDSVIDSIECIRMELGPMDESGRRKPVPVEGSNFVVSCDSVISAIGQRVDRGCFGEYSSKIVGDRGGVVVDPKTQRTSVEWLFAAGDVVTGPKTVVEAVGQGRRAAFAIDGYLSGKSLYNAEWFYYKDTWRIAKPKWDVIDSQEFSGLKTLPKNKQNVLSIKARNKNFKEIECGYDEIKAVKSARRCLTCGCGDLYECKLREYAVEYKAQVANYLGEMVKRGNDDSHAYLTLEPNKCILCGQCVQACGVLSGKKVLNLYNRGFETLAAPEYGTPWGDTKCDSDGSCVAHCPTGAITEKNPYLYKNVTVVPERRVSVCTLCGMRCRVESWSYGSVLLKSKGNICKYARFGGYLVNHPERLSTNQAGINNKGVYKTVELSQAIKFFAKKLLEVTKKCGAGSVLFLVSGNSSNEEVEQVVGIAKKIGGAKVASLGLDFAGLLSFDGNESIENIGKYPRVAVVDTDVEKYYPYLGILLRQYTAAGKDIVSLRSNVNFGDGIKYFANNNELENWINKNDHIAEGSVLIIAERDIHGSFHDNKFVRFVRLTRGGNGHGVAEVLGQYKGSLETNDAMNFMLNGGVKLLYSFGQEVMGSKFRNALKDSFIVKHDIFIAGIHDSIVPGVVLPLRLPNEATGNVDILKLVKQNVRVDHKSSVKKFTVENKKKSLIVPEDIAVETVNQRIRGLFE
ncbi:MAG: FAD-dependent oxidoreductase [Elusimicrobiota bacterium]